MADIQTVRTHAETLARENKKADPDIQKVYWFPNSETILLAEVEDSIPPTVEGELIPVYFRASQEYGVPLPSGIALLRSDEVGRLRLPEEWGNWDDALELELTA